MPAIAFAAFRHYAIMLLTAFRCHAAACLPLITDAASRFSMLMLLFRCFIADAADTIIAT